MQNRGDVSKDEHKLRVLESRQELTGADRQWAGQYEPGDVLRYSRGSKTEGIAPGEYARVSSVEWPVSGVNYSFRSGLLIVAHQASGQHLREHPSASWPHESKAQEATHDAILGAIL